MATKKGLSSKVASKTGDHQLRKSKSGAKSTQGGVAKAGAMSETRRKQPARTDGRGVGSEYAYAVQKGAEDMAKAKAEGFLGKQKVLLNPREQVDRQMLYKGKGKKLDQGKD